MPSPYVVITLVENGWTIAVNGVLTPRIFVASTADDVLERLNTVLPDLVCRHYDALCPTPISKEDPS